MNQLLLTTVLLFFFFSSNSQDYKYPEDMGAYSKEDIQNYCWIDNKHTPDELAYPEEWNKQSAIYLFYEQKYQLRRIPGVPLISGPEVFVAYLGHYRVKILDESARKDFSEVYYFQGSHGNYNTQRLDSDFSDGKFFNGRHKDVLRIKVIKPNGKEILLDDTNILTDGDNKRKAAIPNLEIGDILDYYCFTYDRVYEPKYAIINQFPLNQIYPIQKFTFTVLTDQHWNIQFTSGEHKLELTEKKLDKNTYLFQIQQKQIEKTKSTRWNYYYRSGPYIRLLASPKENFIPGKEKNNEPLHSSTISSSQIIDTYREYYQESRSAGNEYAKFKSFLNKKYDKQEIPKEIALEELHYYMRHHFTNQYYVLDRYNGSNHRSPENIEFTGHIIFALQKLEIPYDIVVVVAREVARIEDVPTIDYTDYLIRAKLDSNYFYFYRPSPFTHFNECPYSIESVESYVVEATNKKGSKMETKKVFLPSSKLEDNLSKYVSSVNFMADNIETLKVSTLATLSGHQMESYYSTVDWVNMIWTENRIYKTRAWGHLEIDKTDEMQSFVQAQRDKRKESFENIAKDHFEMEDNAKLLSYETYTTGNTFGEKNLSFRFDCELKDLVKKVGPNYILKAGMLVGGQLALEESEMERTIDIYMDFPRGYEYTIDITIPDNYEVQGLKNLEINVDNEAGTLKSSATLNGNVLTILFKKYYKHNFEPAENWAKMKEFLIPGAEFITKEILLKKKV